VAGEANARETASTANVPQKTELPPVPTSTSIPAATAAGAGAGTGTAAAAAGTTSTFGATTDHLKQEVTKCAHHDQTSWTSKGETASTQTPSAAADKLHFDTMGEALGSNNARDGHGSAKNLEHEDAQQRHQAEKQMDKALLQSGSDAGVIDKVKAVAGVVTHSVAATYHGMLAGKDDKTHETSGAHQHQAGGLPDHHAVDQVTPTKDSVADPQGTTTTQSAVQQS